MPAHPALFLFRLRDLQQYETFVQLCVKFLSGQGIGIDLFKTYRHICIHIGPPVKIIEKTFRFTVRKYVLKRSCLKYISDCFSFFCFKIRIMEVEESMSSIKNRIIELHNGIQMPSLGYRIDRNNKESISLGVKNAVSAGFRHFDFPADSAIEKAAAAALRESGVPRYELFLTMKLADEDHGYNRALRAFDQCLKRIGTDYADMFLVSWPDPAQYRDRYEEISKETWRALEEIYKSGKAHAIGFANFHADHIESILAGSEIAPMFNQAKIYPGFPFTENLECADKHRIQTEGYLPAEHDAILNCEELKIFARKYKTTPRNICIRYLFEKGCAALCQGMEKDELFYAWNAFDLKFEKEDMFILDAMRNYGPLEKDSER